MAADTFVNQLTGTGTICFTFAPGYRLVVTVQHVGADYVQALDEHGKKLLVPVAAIAWWGPQ
jgi:hypothetical protein